jgi:hypothetical protein
MQADFLDAHQRHWDDAEHLFRAGRWANADHLYGVTVECGLKRLMHAFGMQYDLDGNPSKKEDRKHANGIWARFESYRSGHLHGTGYVLPSSDPFLDWDISQRYANQSHFNRARAQYHQVGASAVCELIKKAQREGLI